MSTDYTLHNIAGHDFHPQDVAFSPDDVLLAAVPSFGGRVPQFAVQFYSKLKGNGAKAVLIATFGNRAIDDTLAELRDAVTRAGFSVRGAIAAVGQHSLCPELAAGRPTPADLAELATMAGRLRDACEGPEAPLSLPGNESFVTYSGLPFHTYADNKCVSCGVCAKACPVYAIPADNPSATHDSVCITCMRCTAVCPTGARRLPDGVPAMVKQTLTAAGAFDGAKTNTLYIAGDQ